MRQFYLRLVLLDTSLNYYVTKSLESLLTFQIFNKTNQKEIISKYSIFFFNQFLFWRLELILQRYMFYYIYIYASHLIYHL